MPIYAAFMRNKTPNTHIITQQLITMSQPPTPLDDNVTLAIAKQTTIG